MAGEGEGEEYGHPAAHRALVEMRRGVVRLVVVVLHNAAAEGVSGV